MNIQLNGQPTLLNADATLAQAVALIVHDTAGTAAAVNERVVPQTDWAQYTLHDGDSVEVLTAVQGG
ncbi:sulfur carrier protein ThiS [Corynebacterium gerontici]|uniref:Sulfur carrier protein ThiS n=1 Tax=Corynebacterium gerontici TaxID=2079234 RepID=A0A3G6IXM7_9CORY|nr:sulfur carrier protein ThiS [Corynebacterium gerontici]AZA10407.1 Sulfur carrier protein ThiS [Corynebacterium gerontici]